MPDLSDPRYLHEVGWFVHHERHGPMSLGDNFDEEREQFSQWLLEAVLDMCEKDASWLRDKVVVSAGCGCTGELATWPAAVKIGIDPLVYVYQRLGMLVDDKPGTSPTVYLANSIEDIPLMDELADLAISRNSLDHMPDPRVALAQIARILKPDGAFFLAVDLGGEPTPDEPTVMSEDELTQMVSEHFDIEKHERKKDTYSGNREYGVRILGRKRAAPPEPIDKDHVLETYEQLLAADNDDGEERLETA